MDGSCSEDSGSRRSGPAEERAQPAEGRCTEEDRGRIRADDVYPEYEIKGSATSVVHPSFELNLACCCFTSASGLDRLFTKQLRPQSDIYPSHSLA